MIAFPPPRMSRSLVTDATTRLVLSFVPKQWSEVFRKDFFRFAYRHHSDGYAYTWRYETENSLEFSLINDRTCSTTRIFIDRGVVSEIRKSMLFDCVTVFWQFNWQGKFTQVYFNNRKLPLYTFVEFKVMIHMKRWRRRRAWTCLERGVPCIELIPMIWAYVK